MIPAVATWCFIIATFGFILWVMGVGKYVEPIPPEPMVDDHVFAPDHWGQDCVYEYEDGFTLEECGLPIENHYYQSEDDTEGRDYGF